MKKGAEMVLYLNKKHTLKLRIPVAFREDLLRVLKYILAGLSICALGLGCIAIPAFARITHITLEAGDKFSASEISGDGGAYFVDYDASWTRKPGVYYFKMISGGKEREVRLKVVDTKAPEVKVRNIDWAIGGGIPTPEDFIESIYEATDYTGEYVTPFSEIEKMGLHNAEIRFTDTSGNRTEVFGVKMNLVSDNEKPEIKFLSERITVNLGDDVNYLQFIKVSDNCAGKIDIKIDDSGVDFSTVGSYTVTVTATDRIGNKTKKELKVSVVEPIGEK